MGNIYNIRDLSFSFGKNNILNDISFHVEEGDIVGLIGQNGAGKSTLINIMTGVYSNYSGNVFFKSYDNKENLLALKSNIAAVLDRSATYGTLSVVENINYYCKLLNVPIQYGLDLLDEFGMTEYTKFKVSQLSSGYQQRLRIVIALLNDPSVLFLDEPWIALDPINSQFLTSKILSLNKLKGLTIIISGHDLNELEVLCTKFLMIKNGSLILAFSKEQSNSFLITTITDHPKNLQLVKSEAFYRKKETNEIKVINMNKDFFICEDILEEKTYSLKELYFEIQNCTT
ncbi:ABC transporter ATP-binding protein [Sphingobacterium kitahiroshimense]|uniref:ABC transporter ATP-binding protein n=1 Tax=Sphingobacterium sp. B16(2022) TaxID=2914044 RepID=UPI00143A5F67|nr:ABC transporter ATP-binding protein [Sphingobacterium sp. B16(2022)]NJI73235.1 ABC transporter ATP-binding protein [Sphingobacterium sp. B16(2022)]